MADKEKVIKALECCGSDNWACYYCPYENIFEEDGMPRCTSLMAREAIELLKEQDAVEPQIISGIPVFNPHTGLEHDTVYRCGHCGMTLIGKANYCFKCGKKVKWDAVN